MTLFEPRISAGENNRSTNLATTISIIPFMFCLQCCPKCHLLSLLCSVVFMALFLSKRPFSSPFIFFIPSVLRLKKTFVKSIKSQFVHPSFSAHLQPFQTVLYLPTSSFQTNITIFTTNMSEKMSIQFTVLGF